MHTALTDDGVAFCDCASKAYHYETRGALAAHAPAFVTAHNFGKHLKRLR